jgi:hypothetical protein
MMVFCVHSVLQHQRQQLDMAAEQLQTRESRMVRQGRLHVHCTVHHRQPGRPPCWVISPTFGLIGTTLPKPPLAWVETVLVILAPTQKQREGMGLLEYQAVPSLRDVAHDGWLCKFTI